MSFQASAREIWLENGNILVAIVADESGDWQESRIDLNDFIGNEDGWFMWDGVSKYFYPIIVLQPAIPVPKHAASFPTLHVSIVTCSLISHYIHSPYPEISMYEKKC